MKLPTIIAMFVLVTGSCKGENKAAPAKTEDRSAPATPTAAAPAVAEAIERSKKDLEEVKGDIAKGSYSNACRDLMRRNPEVEKADKALAADIDKTCNVDLPASIIEQGVKAVEDEAAEMAKKPNPNKLKRVNSRCPNPQLAEARATLEAAGKLDEALKAKLAKYNELCK
jgi:hypothetical protein